MVVERPHPILRAGQLLAALVQGGTAITLLVLLIATDWLSLKVQLGITYPVAPGEYDFWHWFDYAPGWILFAMCTVTAAFHAFLGTVGWKTYVQWAVGDSVHLFSWIEYFVTASLMTWVLLALSGTREFGALLLGSLAIGVTNGIGLIVELALSGQFNAMLGRFDWREGRTALAAMLGMALAWGLSLLPWIGITLQVIAAYQFGRDDIPWFVLVSIAQTFVLYNSFGLVFMAQHVLVGARRDETWTARFAGAYVLLSFIAKQGLTWILVGGLIGQRV